MKGISRLLIIFFIGGFVFISCTEINVAYENKELLNAPHFSIKENYGDYYIFTHVDTTMDVLIIFHVFTKKEISHEKLSISEFSLKDSNGNMLHQVKSEILKTQGDKSPTEGFYNNIFMFDIGSVPIDRETLLDKDIEYLTVEYEINGTKYLEKLDRIERRSFINQ